jgi:hypothetical protein
VYAAIRRYSLQSGATVGEVVAKVQAGFIPLIEKAPGFVSYQVLDNGAGEITSITVFRDKAGADESTRRAAEWVKGNLASMFGGAPQVTAGEIKFERRA